MSLRRSDRRPREVRLKWESIARTLATRIHEGAYPPGAFLPPERVLAAEFQTSRPTIRKALRKLAESGSLVSVPGVGTRVPAPENARSPVNGKIIALALPDITNRFFIEVTEAVEYALLQRGYQLLLGNYRHQAELEQLQIRQYAERQVAGVILGHDAGRPLPSALELLKKASIPVVMLFNAPLECDYDSVVVDERAGIQQVLRYLTSLGHRRIAFCRPLPDPEEHPRETAFRQLMAERGLSVPEHFIIPFAALEDSSCAKLKQLMNKDPRPTAIVGGNDRSALMLLRQLARLNIQVPQLISVTGFDNLRFTEHLPVPLTTVDQPKTEMGRRAVEMLLERIEMNAGWPPRHEVFQPHLVIRESCTVPARA